MIIPDDIATRFTDAFDPLVAAEVAQSLTCSEVDALADLLTALGRPDLAAEWVDAHADQDDQGDAHYRQPH
ncbi:hypothetical protein [Sphaerisporangium sp. TRM90804]|uniref:hypothetical protein n=1 Tax=Sphaerisporangium sp. TRM90804 TaxID=3031113 RepID=UPI002446F10A|nr:hypothetical protein [Sphaerisporangium sp. TRM90804]MDH2425766.1 hypothetical protein [Sphaerisporangium sp. TRM90804]